ncbi:MAG: hypothetical protein N4A38_04935 [Candidatus Gracilibacteria bacterium]|nr:hypothetical protein [Candidatus Gracilibacteria bacterium]
MRVFLDKFAFIFSIFIFSIFTAVYGFIVYNNDIEPLKIGVYELTNETQDKTVRFVSMSHIGRGEFYESVYKELEKAKDEGFVLFYEGIFEGSEENLNKFNSLLGLPEKPDENFYAKMSKIFGLSSQNTKQYVEIFGENAYRTDLGLDYLMEQYNALPNQLTKNFEGMEDISTDVVKNFEKFEKLPEKQKKITSFILRTSLNFILKKNFVSEVKLGLGNEAISEIVINLRNENLADEVRTSEHKKIIVIYGGLHYEGFLENLQAKSNSPRQEKLIKYNYPIFAKKY